jgi:hypothetical protein
MNLCIFRSLTLCSYCILKTRNKALAWRLLAYIPDPELHYSRIQKTKFAASVKQLRLFKLFSVAIKSFIEAQQEGAMDHVYLVLRGKAIFVILKIRLYVTITPKIPTFLSDLTFWSD